MRGENTFTNSGGERGERVGGAGETLRGDLGAEYTVRGGVEGCAGGLLGDTTAGGVRNGFGVPVGERGDPVGDEGEYTVLGTIT